MTQRRGAMVAALVLALAAATSAGANTATGPRETISLDLTTTQPGAATGVTFAARYRDPRDPNAVPPALRRVVLVLADGARTDTAVAPRCTASDSELQMNGESACPPGSKIGEGHVNTVSFGLAPFSSDIGIFNGVDQQLQLIKFGNSASAVVRTKIHGTTFDTLVPTCFAGGGQPPDSCPDDQTHVIDSKQSGAALTFNGAPYASTPPDCPASGHWETKVTLYFGDGNTDTLVTQQPCAPAGSTGVTPSGSGQRLSPPRSCVGRRVLRIHVARGRGVRFRSVVVEVAGRRRSFDPGRATVDLRGLPRGSFRVKIVAVTRGGKRLTSTRRYRTCAKKPG